MKKLFFFKSSASSSGNNSAVPPRPTNKQICWENSSESGLYGQALGRAEDSFQSPTGLFSKSHKHADSQGSGSGPRLRRSRSLSTAAYQVKDHSRSPSFISGDQYHQPGSACSSRSHNDSSGNSSTSSSNISSKIVDRYIDGEQQPEKTRSRKNLQKIYGENGNHSMKLPPKIQYTAPNSPTDGGARYKPRAHSFREAKGADIHFSSKDWKENGFGHESPRSLAKNVIERLSQFHSFSKITSKEVGLDNPITVEDVFARSVNEGCESDPDEALPKGYSFGKPHRMAGGYHSIDDQRFQKHDVSAAANCDGLSYVVLEEDVDAELQRRLKEVKERVTLFSKEFERECFLLDSGFDVSVLVQTIRNLEEERLSLAMEVSGLLQSRIAERTSAKEELRSLKEESGLQARRLEKEKNEIQSGLEKELDRRSSDWSLKLEKCQLEEQRLRERVRELAEHNVSLQREVSSFSDRETETKKLIICSDHQLKEMTEKMEEMKEQNLYFQQNVLELQQKCKIVEEKRDIYRRNYEEKEKECKELHKSITRLLRICSDQEKTITGLRDAFSEDLKNPSMERVEKHVARMQMEQMRLSGVEMALRRESESYRIEADSLRQENITLLNRLKGDGKGIVAATYKLDKELLARIYCLQNQGLTMLNESSDLCSKLFEFIKGTGGQLLQDSRQEMEVKRNGLDGQFIVESESRIQSLKSGIESLTRSLQMMSGLVAEKSSSLTTKFQSQFIDPDKLAKLNDQSSEDMIKTELKAECLLTSLLREKLYSKELQVEQLQAELATAVRGNDILKSEVQNALANHSCVNHKLKDLELQMLKKDENISHLHSDLKESMKELAIVKGILPQVSEERDRMWEQVKQYAEQNMLLDKEINGLRKKIEVLDEDILVKEGQITILKDSLGKKPFDLLGSPDPMHEFLLN
ncbi:golgin subfamily B member 1-like [Neltuma alba]|uniref:golgin subfamily B member 1-like n=1 Tax=Neltuma alba TaxID=207710 RepID=UPI0010A3EC1B|nr:golgin subfamily B member 1-like [Prosopis alba]